MANIVDIVYPQILHQKAMKISRSDGGIKGSIFTEIYQSMITIE